jgi:hypothetical protein
MHAGKLISKARCPNLNQINKENFKWSIKSNMCGVNVKVGTQRKLEVTLQVLKESNLRK